MWGYTSISASLHGVVFKQAPTDTHTFVTNHITNTRTLKVHLEKRIRESGFCGGKKEIHKLAREMYKIQKRHSFQTQLNYVYYTQLHVSTSDHPSSSKLLFKTRRGRNVHYASP
jgi:hypothetical protein